MSNAKASWGIEIGAHAIKAIQLEREGDDVRVTDFSYIPHKKVLTTPDLDQNEMIRISLGQFISQKELEGEHLVMSVPGHAAFARFAKLPPVEAKKVPDIVKFEAVQQIPFPIDEVEWDYQTFTSEDTPEIEVGIFAITRERVQQRLELYNELHLSPERLTLSPVAVFNAMSYDQKLDERKSAVMYIDIGTQATDVIIAEEGRCWIRTFPLGGTHFTEAIAEAFKLSYSKAEKLKLEAASSKYAKQIMQAMRPVFTDLLQDLQRSIGYYQSMHRDAELDTVVGLGSTFKIPGLRKFIGQQLQVDCVRLDEYKRISVGGREAASFSEHAVNFATAYGLALQGVGLAAIDANLVPVHTLREQMWQSKTKWFGAAAAIVVIGSALLLVPPMVASSKLGPGDAPPEVTSTISVAKSLKNQYQNEQASATAVSATQDFALILKDRDVWPHIIQDVAAALQSTDPQDELLSGDPMQALAIPATERRLVMLEFLGGRYRYDQAKDARLIDISVDVELSHSVPVEFLNQTVAQWLRDNAERPDVPYRILPDSISLNPQQMVRMTAGDDGQLLASASGSQPDSGRNRGPGRSGGSNRGGDVVAGGTGAGPSGGAARGKNVYKGPQLQAPTGGSAGAAGDSGGAARDPSEPTRSRSGADWTRGLQGGGDQATNVDLGALNERAPIPNPPPLYKQGDTVYRLPITFTVEITDETVGPGADVAKTSEPTESSS